MKVTVLSLFLFSLLSCKTDSHTHLVQHVPPFTNTIQLTETEVSFTPEDTSNALIIFYDTSRIITYLIIEANCRNYYIYILLIHEAT